MSLPLSEAPRPGSRPDVTGELFDELAVRFDLDRSAGWRDLGGGSTTNLLVRDLRGRARVARVHRLSTTAERLHAEQEVRRLLAEAGIPTVIALATTRAGSGHLVELESYVPSDGRVNTADRLSTGFAELARLHEILRCADLPDASRTTMDANYVSLDAAAAVTRLGADRIRGWGLAELDPYAGAVVDLVEAVTDAERAWDRDRIEQVVHGDFWDDNVLFVGSRVVAVLDFGFMAQRLRVDDLALPFWFSLLEPGHGVPGEAERRLLRALLDSYDHAAVRPLTMAERMSVPLVVARQPAWSVGHWVLRLDEGPARRHALDAAAELEVAEAMWREMPLWQDALA